LNDPGNKPGFFIFRKINLMRISYLLVAITVVFNVYGQSNTFPQSWTGNWKGELQWYKGTAKEPQKVNMELRIHPTDSAGKYSWQIIYGSETADNRPYILLAKDTAKGHWAIDENNGIVLDQFWLANKFCGAFTVKNSTVVNNYWIDNGKLIVEFYSISAKPVAITGKGTEESPSVDSYKVSSYQKAILSRQ
jgi:hypothetical protein